MSAEFRLLGDVEARVDGDLVELGHARQRCVLAVLLVEVNRSVSADQLLDRVWGERPPHRARNVLSGYLSRLRQALASVDEVRITRQPGGYVLVTEPAIVDLHLFRRLVADAEAASGPEAAAALLTRALRLWRGEPFTALDTPWLNDVRDALAAERYAAELERNDLALATGRHGAVLTDIAAAAERNPLDERLAGQLMLALYRCGRQADALAAFRTTRRRLVEELGADPEAPLQRLHQQILDGDPALTAALPERASGTVVRRSVPRQLPAPPRGFTGRDRELAELDALLTAGDEQPGAVLITALSGTGGIGKTALALHWACRVAERFPDGQLYANLRGFDPSGTVMSAGEAVRGFLEALGVPPQQIPTTVDAQVGLYRSVLADRRVLVVLDNGRDVAHVRPLLPASPGSLALVTSRNRLTGLVVSEGAVPLGLDVLSHDEARAMLGKRLGADRVATEPKATDDLIAFCGRLPLALAIVAARAATERRMALAALSDALRSVRDRLDALEVGDATVDVRAVFSWSYQALAPEPARVFRLLGLHPGPDVSSWAAASLCGEPEPQVRKTLGELTAANLVAEPEPGRYTFHDLLRAYATELVETHDTAHDRRTAQQRMRGHYLHTADTADGLIYPHRDPVILPPPAPGVVGEQLADSAQALGWFSREAPALLAVARQAGSGSDEIYPGQLASTMVNYLARSGLWLDWIDVQRAALSSARRRSAPYDLAVAHRGLARASLQLAHYDDASEHGHAALDLYRRIGDISGEAQTHLVLGAGATQQGNHATALVHFTDAIGLYGDIGHEAGRGTALNNAGFMHAMLGDFTTAVAICQEAVEVLQAAGDRYGLSSSWDSLGYAHHHLRHHEQAIACYRTALELIRGHGDRYFEAETLDHLGDTLAAAGDLPQAREAWQSAAHIYDELGHADAEQIRAKLRAAG